MVKGSVTASVAPRNNPQVEERSPKLFIEETGLLPHKAFDSRDQFICAVSYTHLTLPTIYSV